MIIGKLAIRIPAPIANVPIILYNPKRVFLFLLSLIVWGRIACSIERKALVSDPVILSVPIRDAMISLSGFSVIKKMTPEIDIIIAYNNRTFLLPIRSA